MAACAWVWSSARRQRELSWPSAQAVVLERRLVTTGKRNDTEIVVRYAVRGQTIERALFWDGNYFDPVTLKHVIAESAPLEGASISVRYDPDDVDDAALDYESRRHTKAWQMGFATSAMFVCWAVIAWLLAKLGDVWVGAKRARRRVW